MRDNPTEFVPSADHCSQDGEVPQLSHKAAERIAETMRAAAIARINGVEHTGALFKSDEPEDED